MSSLVRRLLVCAAIVGLAAPLALAHSHKEADNHDATATKASMGHMESSATPEALPPLKADLPSLLAEVKRLRKEVARLDELRPTFTNFMPNVAERFHVMHFAGDAGDWAVAGHEAAELDRLVDVAKAVNPEKGKLMKSFIGGDLEHLDDAIAHGDKAAFDKTLSETVQHCNACHVAVGSPFIKVSLNVAPNMTIRHPHILTKEHAMAHHHHAD